MNTLSNFSLLCRGEITDQYDYSINEKFFGPKKLDNSLNIPKTVTTRYGPIALMVSSHLTMLDMPTPVPISLHLDGVEMIYKNILEKKKQKAINQMLYSRAILKALGLKWTSALDQFHNILHSLSYSKMLNSTRKKEKIKIFNRIRRTSMSPPGGPRTKFSRDSIPADIIYEEIPIKILLNNYAATGDRRGMAIRNRQLGSIISRKPYKKTSDMLNTYYLITKLNLEKKEHKNCEYNIKEARIKHWDNIKNNQKIEYMEMTDDEILKTRVRPTSSSLISPDRIDDQDSENSSNLKPDSLNLQNQKERFDVRRGYSIENELRKEILQSSPDEISEDNEQNQQTRDTSFSRELSTIKIEMGKDSLSDKSEKIDSHTSLNDLDLHETKHFLKNKKNLLIDKSEHERIQRKGRRKDRREDVDDQNIIKKQAKYKDEPKIEDESIQKVPEPNKLSVDSKSQTTKIHQKIDKSDPNRLLPPINSKKSKKAQILTTLDETVGDDEMNSKISFSKNLSFHLPNVEYEEPSPNEIEKSQRQLTNSLSNSSSKLEIEQNMRKFSRYRSTSFFILDSRSSISESVEFKEELYMGDYEIKKFRPIEEPVDTSEDLAKELERKRLVNRQMNEIKRNKLSEKKRELAKLEMEKRLEKKRLMSLRVDVDEEVNDMIEEIIRTKEDQQIARKISEDNIFKLKTYEENVQKSLETRRCLEKMEIAKKIEKYRKTIVLPPIIETNLEKEEESEDIIPTDISTPIKDESSMFPPNFFRDFKMYHKQGDWISRAYVYSYFNLLKPSLIH